MLCTGNLTCFICSLIGLLKSYVLRLRDCCWLFSLSHIKDSDKIERVFRITLQRHLVCYRWVNRKDPRGKNIFSGGFLGLDNIG